MKRVWGAVLAVIIAGCTGVGSDSRHQSGDIDGSLQIPSTLKETPPRALKGKFVPVSWSSLPGWEADKGDGIWLGLVNNCRGLMRPISGALTLPARANPQAWLGVCRQVSALGDSLDAVAAKQFIQQHLQAWSIVNHGDGLVTGYYEPIVKGARTQGGKYQWPMYAPPPDLLTIDLGTVYPELVGKRVRGKRVGNKVIPYDTRAEIGRKAKKPPVIVWLDDPIEAFFLQVQGSGSVQLTNGDTVRLAYADHNGRAYSSIGRWLVNRGEMSLSQASMQTIKKWAQQHPEQIEELLNVNDAMVFFKEEKIKGATMGPKGAYGIPLMAKRAIAVDPDFIPLGTPVFLSTTMPSATSPLQRLVYAQDTGSAIKGANRADFFWGRGEKAGKVAGQMKQRGIMWLLWPRDAGEPSAR